MMDNKKKNQRGAALPETSLMMGLFFLLLFGSFNLAFLGYSQMRADGATYVAARAAAANPSTAPTAAATALKAVFPNLPSGSVSVQTIGSLVQATYSGTAPGLILLGNKGTGNFNVYSREVEPVQNSSGILGTAIGSSFPFSIGTNGYVPLNNYPSARNIWLAQTITIISSGCNNGPFIGKANSTTNCYEAKEFASHCMQYAKLKFTTPDTTIPTVTQASNARQKEILRPTNWDPNTSGSINSVIYAWDASPHTYPTPTYASTAIVTGGTENGMKC